MGEKQYLCAYILYVFVSICVSSYGDYLALMNGVERMSFETRLSFDILLNHCQSLIIPNGLHLWNGTYLVNDTVLESVLGGNGGTNVFSFSLTFFFILFAEGLYVN